MRKKLLSYLLAVALLLTPFQYIQAWSSFRNENGPEQANTISALTPSDRETTKARWKIKFAESQKTAYNSDPVITATNIYIVCRDTLYQLGKNGTVLCSLTLTAPMNSICRMSLSGERLFIPLSGGILQCVDIRTMSALWVSEPFGLQSLTTAFCKNGYVCAGTTNASGTDGLFYCLSEQDGSTQWTYRDAERPCGYYWSGGAAKKESAVEKTEEGSDADYILFGGDNGVLVSHSLTENVVYDTYDLPTLNASNGKIRAGITYDAATDAFYTTTNDGFLYQIKMRKDGTFQSVKSLSLTTGTSDTPPLSDKNCTSTPTVWNGRIYVCSFDGACGQVNVADAATMQMIYSASAPDCRDIKSSPLVSTGYATAENGQRVYVYFTQNAPPGGIYYIEDNMSTTSAQIRTLFAPEEGQQFCLSSVAADTDGTLYYSNDSGTLFAVAAGSESDDPPTAEPTSAPIVGGTNPTAPPTDSSLTATPTAAPERVSTAKPADATQAPITVTKTGEKTKKSSPKKPRNVHFRKKKKGSGKYQITFMWKKGKNSSHTVVRIHGKRTSGSSRAYKQNRRTRGQRMRVTLKKGTYTIRIYACRTTGENVENGTKKTMKTSGAVTLRLRL